MPSWPISNDGFLNINQTDGIHLDEHIPCCKDFPSLDNIDFENYQFQASESILFDTMTAPTEASESRFFIGESNHSSQTRDNCPLCELSFANYDQLVAHVEIIHNGQSAIHCHFCDLYCPNTMLLRVHIDSFHKQSASSREFVYYSETHLPPSSVFSCYFCGLNFNDMNNLNLHIGLYHPQHLQPTIAFLSDSSVIGEEISYNENIGPLATLAYAYHTCDVCRISFPLHADLERHTAVEHDVQTIPQVDGIDQELFEFMDVTPSIRTASYSLNQSKQVTKIREDANINDYEVTVNNNDQNVTIKCSSGFYIQVAKASFVSIDESSTFSTGKFGISVDDVTITKDQKGLEATKLIHFSFKSEQARSGGVAVHLHHSSRTIQIQGSHVMPDSTRSPVWFLQNVTLKRFKDIAKSKQFAIKNFNDAARALHTTASAKSPSTNSNNCQSCHLIFNTQSKPSQCQFCPKFFHKGCLKDHNKLCKKPPLSALPCSSSNTSLVASRSSAPSAELGYNCSSNQVQLNSCPTSLVSSTATSLNYSIAGLQSSLVYVSSTVSSRTASSATSSSSRDQSSLVSGLAARTGGTSSQEPSPLPGPSFSLNPQEQRSLTSGCNNTSKPSGKQVHKKKQNAVPTSASEHAIELLKKELAAAQAKIVLLDNEIKDKDQEQAVLWARIKILEEKQNTELLDKYFPFAEVPGSKPSASAPKPSSTGPAQPSTSVPSQTPLCSSSRPVSCTATTSATSQDCSSCCNQMWLLHSQCFHQFQQSPCHHQTKTSVADNQTTDQDKKMELARIEVENMRRELIQIKSLLVNIEQSSKHNSSENAVNEARAKSDAETGTDLNESVVSIEEFMADPNCLPPSSSHLNWEDPTIQLL